jgi:putative molybdopterin biosynthesis protein
LPLRIASERGRTEYLMVSLVRGEAEDTLAAYPNAKGADAVTAFSQADGFITIGQHVESTPAGTPVEVQLIGRAHLADLVIIGSHCVGLDLVSWLQSRGSRSRCSMSAAPAASPPQNAASAMCPDPSDGSGDRAPITGRS